MGVGAVVMVRPLPSGPHPQPLSLCAGRGEQFPERGDSPSPIAWERGWGEGSYASHCPSKSSGRLSAVPSGVGSSFVVSTEEGTSSPRAARMATAVASLPALVSASAQIGEPAAVLDGGDGLARRAVADQRHARQPGVLDGLLGTEDRLRRADDHVNVRVGLEHVLRGGQAGGLRVAAFR